MARGGVEAHEGCAAEAAHGGCWRVEGRGDCVRGEDREETCRAPVAPGGGGVVEESAAAHAYEGACSACLDWGDRAGRERTEAHRVPGGTERRQ